MGSSGEHCLQTLSDADKCHLGDDFSEANGSHWNVIPLDDAPRVFYLYSDVGFGGNNQYLSWTEAGGLNYSSVAGPHCKWTIPNISGGTTIAAYGSSSPLYLNGLPALDGLVGLVSDLNGHPGTTWYPYLIALMIEVSFWNYEDVYVTFSWPGGSSEPVAPQTRSAPYLIELPSSLELPIRMFDGAEVFHEATLVWHPNPNAAHPDGTYDVTVKGSHTKLPAQSGGLVIVGTTELDEQTRVSRHESVE